MGIKDQIITNRDNVISMVSCADDYGHRNQIIDHFFWQLLGEKLTDAEIVEYATELASGDGYDQEDFDEVSERLTYWRDGMRKTPTETKP